MVDTVPPSAVLTKLPWDVRSSREQYAHAMCGDHAPALLTMAAIIIDDTDRACDIVATAVCAAYGEEPEFDLGRMRVRLARSVYRRCLGHLAFTERYPQPDRPSRNLRPRTLFDDLTRSQQAILALVISVPTTLPKQRRPCIGREAMSSTRFVRPHVRCDGD